MAAAVLMALPVLGAMRGVTNKSLNTTPQQSFDQQEQQDIRKVGDAHGPIDEPAQHSRTPAARRGDGSLRAGVPAGISLQMERDVRAAQARIGSLNCGFHGGLVGTTRTAESSRVLFRAYEYWSGLYICR